MQPCGHIVLAPGAGGDGQDGLLGIIDSRCGVPRPTVDRDEEAQRYPGGALVAVGQWMVLREVYG